MTSRVVAAIRSAVEHALSWYDPEEAAHRSRETQRVRVRSIRARIASEDIVRRYEQYDGVVRR